LHSPDCDQAANYLAISRGPIAAGLSAAEPDPVPLGIDCLRLDIDPTPTEPGFKELSERNSLLAARLLEYADSHVALALMMIG